MELRFRFRKSAVGYAAKNVRRGASWVIVYKSDTALWNAPRHVRRAFCNDDGRQGLLYSQSGDMVLIGQPRGISQVRCLDNWRVFRERAAAAGLLLGDVELVRGSLDAPLPAYVGSAVVCPYMFDDRLAALYSGSRGLLLRIGRWNDKNQTMRLLYKKGIATPRTLIAKSPSPGALLRDTSTVRIFPAYLKAAVQSAGDGICRVESRKNLRRVLEGRAHRWGAVQLQEILPVDASLCFSYALLPEGVHSMIATEQCIRDGVVWEGNVWPTPWSGESLLSRVAQAAWADGLRGVMGVDAVVCRGYPYVVEVNPRVNGSHVLAVLIARLTGLRSLRLVRVRTPAARRLSSVSIWRWAYTPERGQGFIVRTWSETRSSFDLIFVNDPMRRIERAVRGRL